MKRQSYTEATGTPWIWKCHDNTHITALARGADNLPPNTIHISDITNDELVVELPLA